MKATMWKVLALLCWAAMLFPLLTPSAEAVEATIEMMPKKIEIGSFYHGTELEFEGLVPSDCEVAIVLTGETKEQTFNRKGRVGPLWMNVGSATFEGAPEVYCLLSSSGSLECLALPEQLVACRIGYDALKESTRIKPENSDNDSTFAEFIKLKEDIGLYRILCNSVTLKPSSDGMARFHASLPIPPKMPPGDYEVSLFCFRDARKLSNQSFTLSVEKVGLPKKLSTLAYDHPAAYGILAIVAAMAAGIVMGVLFGSKGKGGH
ncbi:MAG: hypothetical protein Kow0099_06170 [Candidatus Abyssubacteria bacterium]